MKDKEINMNITENNEDFDKVLTEELTNKLKEAYNKGVVDGAMAGWDACIKSIHRDTKDMTSANKIHKYMSCKMREAKNRNGQGENEDAERNDK